MSGYPALAGIAIPTQTTVDDKTRTRKVLEKNLGDWEAQARLADDAQSVVHPLTSAEEAQRALDEYKKKLSDERTKPSNVRDKALCSRCYFLIGKEGAPGPLARLAQDFTSKKEILTELSNSYTEQMGKFSDGKRNAAKIDKEIANLTEVVGAFGTILNKKQIASWGRDRSNVTPRVIEADLATMRTAIDKAKPKFKNEAASPTLKCAGETLVGHLQQMERALDQIAHRARCHRCKTVNGIPRDKVAKQLVRAKIKQLQELSMTNTPPSDQGLTADWKLAQSLKRMWKPEIAGIPPAGKMIGALVCKNTANEEVILYGYSGEIVNLYPTALARVKFMEEILRKPNLDQKEAELYASGLEEALGQIW